MYMFPMLQYIRARLRQVVLPIIYIYPLRKRNKILRFIRTVKNSCQSTYQHNSEESSTLLPLPLLTLACTYRKKKNATSQFEPLIIFLAGIYQSKKEWSDVLVTITLTLSVLPRAFLRVSLSIVPSYVGCNWAKTLLLNFNSQEEFSFCALISQNKREDIENTGLKHKSIIFQGQLIQVTCWSRV